MRVLPICLIALLLSGCSLLNRSPVNQPSGKFSVQNSERQKTRNFHNTTVKLYRSTEDLVGKPFRDLGEVSGESCQVSNQDSPPDIPAARRLLQINAGKRNANAVLLHQCEITSGTPGCYRQAICLGSALDIQE